MNNTTKKHKHRAEGLLYECACGAVRRKGSKEWEPPIARQMIESYLAKTTHEERSAARKKGAEKRWEGRSPEEKAEYMRWIASQPRPGTRKTDRCPCGKFPKSTAERRGHKCEAAA